MSKQIKLPTLLVVAENPSVRFWVKKHLEEEFFVIAAEKKLDAFAALSARLDFIIIDSSLENCDALELCQELKERTQRDLIPIFLVTGSLKKSYREKAIESGVTDFLSDELDIDELHMRIAEGKKAASSRQKTQEIGLAFKAPKNIASSSLKDKFVLNDQALRLLDKAKESPSPSTLLFLRIDRFKELGRGIIPPFSEFLHTILRKTDLVLSSSEGGFVILLPDTISVQARQIAEMLRKKIQQHLFNSEQLTVSIAISPLKATEKGMNQMIQEAIKSLKTETNFIISLDEETQ